MGNLCTLRYKDFVAMLQRRGITTQGCFVFGFGHDDKDVFESTVDLVRDDIPRYSLYTPYPGTPLFRRLMDERRISHLSPPALSRARCG